jgi:hypothetical protein
MDKMLLGPGVKVDTSKMTIKETKLGMMVRPVQTRLGGAKMLAQ